MAEHDSELNVVEKRVGRVRGVSPSTDLYYVLVLFDISDHKKYRTLIKILKSYSSRIQKSVFEAQLRPAQIKQLTESIEWLMSRPAFFNEDDNVRIYKIAGNCEVKVFGGCVDNTLEDDLFF